MDLLELRQEHLSARDALIQSIEDKYSEGNLYLSYSSLSAFRKSPKHFIDYKMKAMEDTESMLIGKAFHCLVLEPHTFNHEFAVAPQCDRRTKAGKETYNEFLESSGDRSVLTASMYDTAVDMAIGVLHNDESKVLIEGTTQRERKIFFERHGFKFVSILDGESNDYIIDLKMMPDADPRKVQREILQRCLWLQGGMYLEAIQQDKDYYIIAADKSGNVSVHYLMPGLLDYGKGEFKRLCHDFEDCLSTSSWHKSYDYRSHNGVYPIDKPQYNI